MTDNNLIEAGAVVIVICLAALLLIGVVAVARLLYVNWNAMRFDNESWP